MSFVAAVEFPDSYSLGAARRALAPYYWERVEFYLREIENGEEYWIASAGRHLQYAADAINAVAGAHFEWRA